MKRSGIPPQNLVYIGIGLTIANLIRPAYPARPFSGTAVLTSLIEWTLLLLVWLFFGRKRG